MGTEICIKLEQSANGSIDNILTLLTDIFNNQTLIMAAIDDLKTQVANLQSQATDLQTALDNEQQQIQALLDTNAAVVTDLNTQIATLQAQIANGATPEQLQDIANSLTAISESMITTKTDLEGTVPDSTEPTTES